MAYSFDADDDRIVTSAVVPPSTWSISANITVDAESTARRQIFSQNDADAETDIYFEFKAGTTNRLTFGYADTSSGFPDAEWTTGFTAGSSHIVVGTWDGTTQSIYADGDPTAKATNNPSNTTPRVNAASIRIGNSRANTNGFEGKISEVGVWNRGLTSAETVLLGKGFSPLLIPNGLIRYWRLVQNANELRQGLNGTVTGAVVSDHPRIINPSSSQLRRFAGAGVAASSGNDWPVFQSRGFRNWRYSG